MRYNFRSSFAIVELMVVMGIMALLYGLTTLGLFSSKGRISLDTTISIFVADIKYQQTKAMLGDIENQTTHNAYGVYFKSDRYVLFRGPTYNISDSNNFTINLDNGVQLININLPDDQIIFASVSGELANYSTIHKTFTFKNVLSGDQKTITINPLGTIVSIN